MNAHAKAYAAIATIHLGLAVANAADPMHAAAEIAMAAASGWVALLHRRDGSDDSSKD